MSRPLERKTAVAYDLKTQNAMRAQGLAGRRDWAARLGNTGLSFRRERTTVIPKDPKYKELAYIPTPLDHSYAPLSPDVENRTESGDLIFSRTLQDPVLHKDPRFKEPLNSSEEIPQMWSDRTVPLGNTIGKTTAGGIFKTAVDGQDYILIPITGPNRECVLAEAQIIFELQNYRQGWFPHVLGYHRQQRAESKISDTYLVCQYLAAKPPVLLTLEKYMENHKADGKMNDIKNVLTILKECAWNVNCLNTPIPEGCMILRNISPETFMVREQDDKTEKSNGNVIETQIVDLGFLLPLSSKDSLPDLEYTADRNFPIWTIAPEVYANKKFHPASDVYAFGHLILHVFIGQNAWIRLGKSPRTFIEELKSNNLSIPPQPINMPVEIYELVKDCLDPNYLERPSMHEVFETISLFLKKLKNEEAERKKT